MINEWKEHEIYWRAFGQFAQFPIYPGNEFMHKGFGFSNTPTQTLPEFLKCEMSRDNTPADPIIFHCHNALIEAFKAYDYDEAVNQYNSIKRRQQKLQ